MIDVVAGTSLYELVVGIQRLRETKTQLLPPSMESGKSSFLKRSAITKVWIDYVE